MHSPPSRQHKHFFYIAEYLIDFDSILSVVPPTQNERQHPDPPSHFLHAANGSLIKTYGERTETFRILGYLCKHQMTVADITTPILRLDFFKICHRLIPTVPEGWKYTVCH